jgi:Fe-S-cluster-containing dehydrogenase component
MEDSKNTSQPDDKVEAQKTSKENPLLTRRDALKIGGTTLATAALTQLVISGPFSSDAVQGIGRDTHSNGHGADHPSTSGIWSIDLAKCIGCGYCVRTCQATNDVADDDMRWNIVFPERTEVGVDFYMNRPCQHCQEAPCTRVCPVGATWVREDGIVEMDYDRCIGCRYCQVACPYDVRRFNWRPPSENENRLRADLGLSRSRTAPARCGGKMHLLCAARRPGPVARADPGR